MINNLEIVEVKTKKQIKEFVEFPLNLYKGNPYFIPAMYGDEIKIFSPKNIHLLTCDQICFIAYRDNKVVGRIQGIIQKQYNEIYGTKKARFSRFHCIDDLEVATALLSKVESWAKEKGMEEVIGPMGYNDLEREGLLIEGFDYLNTYEEEYNYPYYQKLIESNGYSKDVDWLEHRIFPEFIDREKIKKISDRTMQKMKLHLAGNGERKNKFIKKYAEQIFHLIDVCYDPLYGTVPLTEEGKKNLLDNFKLILNTKYAAVVCDENENVVAFALSLPAIGESLQKSGGRLTLPTIIKLLKVINNPKALDLALIGVLPKYQGLGIDAMMLSLLQDILEKGEIEYLETNLMLETNVKVLGNWKFFKNIQHKRRRAFIKNI